MEQKSTNVVWIPDQYEQALRDELKIVKQEKRKKNIQKQLTNVKVVGEAFITGVKRDAFDATTVGVSTVVGLAQGLKYSGNVKRGLLTGLVTWAAISVAGGIAAAGKTMNAINKTRERR